MVQLTQTGVDDEVHVALVLAVRPRPAKNVLDERDAAEVGGRRGRRKAERVLVRQVAVVDVGHGEAGEEGSRSEVKEVLVVLLRREREREPSDLAVARRSRRCSTAPRALGAAGVGGLKCVGVLRGSDGGADAAKPFMAGRCEVRYGLLSPLRLSQHTESTRARSAGQPTSSCHLLDICIGGLYSTELGKRWTQR